MKKTARIPKPDRYQTLHRVDAEQYEYVKRLSVATPRGSIQRIIDGFIFGRGWRDELEQLRKTQRKLGLKDHEFFPPAVRRKMGFKVIPGPRRRTKQRRST